MQRAINSQQCPISCIYSRALRRTTFTDFCYKCLLKSLKEKKKHVNMLIIIIHYMSFSYRVEKKQHEGPMFSNDVVLRRAANAQLI